MACDNQVGVKNILVTFRDCETDETFGPISHQLAAEDLPLIRACGYNNQPLPGGYVSRQLSNASIEMNIIRDLRVPLALYQGCAEMDIQIEYFNGLVYSGTGGTGTGEDGSDGHSVTVTAVFRTLDELLPAGTIQAAA